METPLVGLVLGALGALVGMLATALASNRRAAVRGVSMVPLLAPGERVLVDRLAYVRLAYLGRLPKRGDVALLRGAAASNGQPGGQAGGGQAGLASPDLLLKRIVGLPCETVEVRRDRLWVDGRPLDLGRPVVGSSPGRWTLGPDQYFVLSENLAVGTDSRHTGPVRRSDLLGRAWLVYAPSVRRIR